MFSRSSKNKIKNNFAKIYSLLKYSSNKKTQIPILCYHSIGLSDNFEGDSLNPKSFEEHLKYLKENHTIISLDQAVNIISGNKSSQINNPIVITFDDGYKDNYEIAFPLLKKYSAHATIFVVTSFIDQEISLIDDEDFGPCSWDQICEMDKNEYVTIGAHTNSHKILSELENNEVYREVKLSKEKLESHLNRNVNLFAYPNGQKEDITSFAEQVIREVGFKSACTTSWSTFHKEGDIFAIGRVMISGDDSLNQLRLKALGNYDYIYWFQELRRWMKSFLRIFKND